MNGISRIKKQTGLKSPPSVVSLYIGIVVLTGLIPLVIYWVVLGSAPTIPPAEALGSLAKEIDLAALVDVRLEGKYLEKHINGSLSLPLAQIMEIDSQGDLPQAMRGKTLFLVCDVGLLSAQAARHLTGLGISAFSVRGGMLDWGRAWPQLKDNPYSRFELAGGTLQEPFRSMSINEQGAAALAMLGIKPIYMLLSGAVSLILLSRKATDLRILGGALLVFLIGEIFCALNYLFFKDNSYSAEYLHSFSMAIAFGLFAYALLEGLDERLVHFSQADKRCELLPVCGPCAKYKPVRCGIRRIAQLLGVALVILALIPLLSPFSTTAYNTNIFMIIHYYTRPFVHQWFEATYSPITAIILVCLALLVMQLTPRVTLHPLARYLLCLGVGFLGFGFFRVGLGMLYAETLVWATFWEELTELMFVGAVIYVLWVFRPTLLPDLKIQLQG